MSELTGRTVLLVVPASRFKDEEYDTLKRFMERKKATLKVASTTTREVFGMNRTRVRPDILIEDVKVTDWDAVIFVGGVGTRELWDHAGAQQLARQAVEADIFVGATSFAPVILARAGLLEGREATVYFSETKQITDRGAKYTGATMCRDGCILTCKGTEAMEKFTLGLMKLIMEKPPKAAAEPGQDTPTPIG